jgi:hypothetical protein
MMGLRTSHEFLILVCLSDHNLQRLRRVDSSGFNGLCF